MISFTVLMEHHILIPVGIIIAINTKGRKKNIE